MKLSVIAVCAALFVAVGIAGCSGGYRLPDTEPGKEMPERAAVDETWYGELPCADCRSKNITLTLFHDHTFRMRQVHAGIAGRRDRVEYDLGRWELKGGKLFLEGSMQRPMQFRRVSDTSLEMLDQLGRKIVSKLDYTLQLRSVPDFVSGPYTLRGLFVSDGAAITFKECHTGKTFSLLFERPDSSVLGEYASLRSSSARGVLAELTGRFTLGEAKGGGESIMVRKFGRFLPGESCGELADRSVSLEGTFWRVLSIRGYNGSLEGAAGKPYVRMKSDDGSVSGFAGCNRFGGSYVSDGQDLMFSRLVTSRMACPAGAMELERAFLDALGRTRSWKVRGRILELYDSNSKPLVNLTAVSVR
ncbi:MAG: META domain-containing protein [Prosthecochloris sp.]|nr:META domain-containing protein [Prosthecochloris sp.]